ncbi:MAG: acyltransferase family protein [Bacteroidales bacterium]|nr:acyltransferase family protein [Candidatus Latescibacterota bacterium]
MNNPPVAKPERKYELDWLRVIVTINLIPFHAAWMITSVSGFSSVEKGTVAWKILHYYVNFLSPIHMFLLFLIAGTSTFIALQHRSPKQYIMERVKRLLIPLFTFMVFLFAPLGYFWPTDLDLSGVNYFTQFWPWCLMTTFYSESTGGPNWAHMWFAGYLFIHSLVLLPIFLRIRAGKDRLIDSIVGFLTRRWGAIFLMGIPVSLIFAILSPIWPFYRNTLYSDWGYFTYNMAAFFFGFIIARDKRFSKTFSRHTVAALVLGILFSAAKLFMQFNLPSFSTNAHNLNYAIYSLVAGLNTWFWVVAVMSIAQKYLSLTNRFLRYFNRISYPFYIFHLTVMSIAGHYITRLGRGILVEFVMLCVASFVISVICCELVKRTRLTRFLFGIKGK